MGANNRNKGDGANVVSNMNRLKRKIRRVGQGSNRITRELYGGE